MNSINTSKNILVIGELLADLISEEYVNDLSEAKLFRLYQGGSPANVCANLKWLGASVIFVGTVGTDAIGTAMIASLKKIDLDDAYIARCSELPTSLVFIARSKGSPDFIPYRLADIHINYIPDDLILNASIVHSGAFALSKNPARKNIIDAYSRAAKMGKTISLDWNYSPTVWSEDGQKIFKEICLLKPLLKVSLDDLERFLKKPLSLEDARSFLSNLSTTVTCLTCGREGVWYKHQDDDNWKYQPALTVPFVKDTTGAGDAFWSAFLFHFQNRTNLDLCVQQGIILASKKIQKAGPLYADF